MNAQPSRWKQEENYTPDQANDLARNVVLLAKPIAQYVSAHKVSECLAAQHLRDLVAEAAAGGRVRTSTADHTLKLATRRNIGNYSVLIDLGTMRLTGYLSPGRDAPTWVMSKDDRQRLREAGEPAPNPRACLTWTGRPVPRPPVGRALPHCDHLRSLNVKDMVCNRAVVNTPYFSSLPPEERLPTIRALLEYILDRECWDRIDVHTQNYTVRHGPLLWHVRRDGRLLEQITARSGHTATRYPDDQPAAGHRLRRPALLAGPDPNGEQLHGR